MALKLRKNGDIYNKGVKIVEIKISQDIRKFKTKDIGGFSFKEVGFIVLGVGLAILTYTLCGKSIELSIIPMALVLIVGFFKPCGMTFIQFLRTVGRDTLRPQVYIKETDFEYDMNELQKIYGSEYHVITTGDLIQSSPENNKEKINIYEEDLILR